MTMTQVAVLQSLQVGRPHQYQIEGETQDEQSTWKTSFFRTPSPEPRWLYTTHLDGNVQADKRHHGKLGQAVLLYAAAHYPLWQAEFGRTDIGPGGFGENLTVEGLTEETVCIGDIFVLGEAQIQVTGPRYPCSKIERRWNIEGLTDRAAKTGRTGWYCRVLQEGLLEPGMSITLKERPYPDWTVALTNDFGHSRNRDLEQAKALAACPLLDEWWQELVVKRARGRKR